MPHVAGLRSVYAQVGRLIYFGRMLDKLRLHAAAKLPTDYVANLGDSQFYVLDGRCCRFLGVPYADIRERALTTSDSDEEILAWVHTRGTPRTDEECHLWNRFIMKLGWRDERSAVLAQRIRDGGGFPGKPSRPSSTTSSTTNAVTPLPNARGRKFDQTRPQPAHQAVSLMAWRTLKAASSITFSLSFTSSNTRGVPFRR